MRKIYVDAAVGPCYKGIMSADETGRKALRQLRLQAPDEPDEPEANPNPAASRPTCLGQKPGESLYGFRLREAAFDAAIDLWIDAWTSSGAMMSRAARSLGIAPTNVPQIWKRLGLSADLLNRLAFGKDE